MKYILRSITNFAAARGSIHFPCPNLRAVDRWPIAISPSFVIFDKAFVLPINSSDCFTWRLTFLDTFVDSSFFISSRLEKSLSVSYRKSVHFVLVF